MPKPMFKHVEQYTSYGSYQVTMSWDYLAEHIRHWEERTEGIASLQINPDFQRGHVWTEEQQIKYVEYMISGGSGAKVLYFNCAGWMYNWTGPFVLVDGLQRLTAALKFMDNEIPAFGCFLNYYGDQQFMRGVEFLLNVNNLEHYHEVLRWYIEMNTGGIVHTTDEILKVQRMLSVEQGKTVEEMKKRGRS